MYICAYIMRLKGKCAYVVDDSEDPNIHYSYLAINYGTYN